MSLVNIHHVQFSGFAVTADQSALVPGQHALLLEAVLFDSFGGVVAGTPAYPVPFVVSVRVICKPEMPVLN